MPGPQKFNDDITNEKSREGFCLAIERALELISDDKTGPIASFQSKLDGLSGFMDSCARGFLIKDPDSIGYDD